MERRVRTPDRGRPLRARVGWRGREAARGLFGARPRGTHCWRPAWARFSPTLRRRKSEVSKKRSTQLARQACSLPEKLEEIEPTHLRREAQGGAVQGRREETRKKADWGQMGARGAEREIERERGLGSGRLPCPAWGRSKGQLPRGLACLLLRASSRRP